MHTTSISTAEFLTVLKQTFIVVKTNLYHIPISHVGGQAIRLLLAQMHLYLARVKLKMLF